MARINPQLLERLEDKLGVGADRVYKLIAAKVRETHLPRHLAAIALASSRGINISKFASEDDLQVIRNAARAGAPQSVVAPIPPVERHEGRSPARSSRKSPRRRKGASRRRGNSVFVVHGRDKKARTELFAFLRALGLQPIEWNQAIKLTGQPSPYVGTILETAFREAVAVVVLFTPDDEARLRKRFRGSRDEAEAKLKGQARPNVLFEAGLAFGRNQDNTILVEMGTIRPFSDIAGRHVVHLSNEATSRQEFATKLANAGCNVNTNGSDWLEAGDLQAS